MLREGVSLSPLYIQSNVRTTLTISSFPPINFSIACRGQIISDGFFSLPLGSPWIRIHYESPVLNDADRHKLQGALSLEDSEPFAPRLKVVKTILPEKHLAASHHPAHSK